MTEPEELQAIDTFLEAGWIEFAACGFRLLYQVMPVTQWSHIDRVERTQTRIGVNIAVGDVVRVYHGTQIQNSILQDENSACWFAEILEIVSSASEGNYIRIIWLYRTQDLPAQISHGQEASQLCYTNHMDVVDAETVIEAVKPREIFGRDMQDFDVNNYRHKVLDFKTKQLNVCSTTILNAGSS